MYVYFLQVHVAKMIKQNDICSLYFSARRYGVAHPSQHIILGHYHPASETPFKWRFAGGATEDRFYVFTGICI